jgi:hypothetical protein
MEDLYKKYVSTKNRYESLKKLYNATNVKHDAQTGGRLNMAYINSFFALLNDVDTNPQKKNEYHMVHAVLDLLKDNPTFNEFMYGNAAGPQNPPPADIPAAKNTIIIDSLNLSGWRDPGEIPNVNSVTIKNHGPHDNLIAVALNAARGNAAMEDMLLGPAVVPPLGGAAIRPDTGILNSIKMMIHYDGDQAGISNDARLEHSTNLAHLLSIIDGGNTNFVLVHRTNNGAGHNFIRVADGFRNVYQLKLDLRSLPGGFPVAFPPGANPALNEIDDIGCITLLFMIINEYGSDRVSILSRDGYAWSANDPTYTSSNPQLQNANNIVDRYNVNALQQVDFTLRYRNKLNDIISQNRTLIEIAYNHPNPMRINHSAPDGWRQSMFRFNRM